MGKGVEPFYGIAFSGYFMFFPINFTSSSNPPLYSGNLSNPIQFSVVSEGVKTKSKPLNLTVSTCPKEARQ